jgi:hypothetical protein
MPITPGSKGNSSKVSIETLFEKLQAKELGMWLKWLSACLASKALSKINK